MDLLDTWSIKIATSVAPAEVDLAPTMAQAFIEGGKTREELFHHTESGGLGGFGAADLQAIFPYILRMVSTWGDMILTILSSPTTGNLLVLMDDLLGITDLVERHKTINTQPEEQVQLLNQLLDNFSQGLMATGLNEDQRERLTYRFMKTLLETPQSAQEFIQTIYASKPVEPIRPKRK